MVLVELIQKFHQSREGSKVKSGDREYLMMTDVEADYEVSDHVSFHDVVVQATDTGIYLQISWRVTQDSFREILEDSIESVEVIPEHVTTVRWVPKYTKEN